MFARLFLGIIGIGAGYLMVRYADAIYRSFGSVGLAEKWLGLFGGTRMFIRLLGLLVIFLSMLLATGLMTPMLRSMLGSLVDN